MIVGIVLLFGYVFMLLLAGGRAVDNLRIFLTQIRSLELLLPIFFCSFFLEVALLVFYLVHTLKNTKASESLRIVLGLGHLFLPFVAMPIYYYLYIWRETPPEWVAIKAMKVDQLAKSVI